MSDELRDLQTAVREYCRHEHELDRLSTSKGVSEWELVDKEKLLARSRARMMRLAGIEEFD